MQNTPASLGIIFIVVSLKSAVPLLEMIISHQIMDRKALNSAVPLQVFILVTLTKKLGQKDMTLEVHKEGLMRKINTNPDEIMLSIIKMIHLQKVLGVEKFSISTENLVMFTSPLVKQLITIKGLHTCLIGLIHVGMILVTIGHLHTMSLNIIGHHTDLKFNKKK